MKVTVLGTGTSSGVPVPGCSCAVCISDDEKNKRLRCSLYIEIPNQSDQHPLATTNFLIDTSTDLRAQALRYKLGRLDAVLYTHIHADHTNGVDDLRCFNFIHKRVIPLYGTSEFVTELKQRFGYVFSPDPDYEGAPPPKLSIESFDPQQPLTISDVTITPLPAWHGKLPVTGFRIGDFAYLTDCSEIPTSTKELMQNLDTLILDGLRFKPHKTHFTIDQSIAEIEILKPKRAFLTHLSHDVDHHQGNNYIRERTKRDISLAWDGLVITCS